MRGEASQEDFTRAFGKDGKKRFTQSQQNYEVMRGLSDKQQANQVDTQQPYQQLNQHRGRGESIEGRIRVARQPDINRADVQAQANAGDNIKVLDDGSMAKDDGSMAKMKTRHLNSVGIKQSSPMKKGYFKNK